MDAGEITLACPEPSLALDAMSEGVELPPLGVAEPDADYEDYEDYDDDFSTDE